MVFSAELYEKVFPRKTKEPTKSPEVPKPGNVLEEVEKVETPKPVPEPIDPEPETGGGGENGD